MTITFNQIPRLERVPGVYVEFDSSRAISGTALKPYKLLAIGQKRSAGNFTVLIPQRVSSISQAIAGGGAGSMVHGMAAAILANNSQTELWIVAVADPVGGTAATGTIVFAGTPTVSGTIYVYIAGRRLQVPVTTSSTPTTLATSLAASIQTDTTLPVSATSSTGTVTATAKNVGTCGNEIDLRVSYNPGEALPAGVTVTITDMASGAGDADLSAVWANLGDEQFDVIAIPATDATNLTSVETELASRWDSQRAIEGVAIAASSKTFAHAATLGASRNSQFLSIVTGYKSPTPVWEIAAAAAGQVAAAAQNDPARPFQTLPLIGVLAPSIADRFDATERNQLLFSGISTTRVDAGGVVRLERLITTYKVNSLGTDDPSFLDATTIFTLGFLRYSLRSLFSTRYPRHKLADDDARIGVGQAVLTPSIARAEVIGLFSAWEALGLVEGIDQFKAELIVERDTTDPSRLNIQIAPDLINGLAVLAVQVQFRL